MRERIMDMVYAKKIKKGIIYKVFFPVPSSEFLICTSHLKLQKRKRKKRVSRRVIKYNEIQKKIPRCEKKEQISLKFANRYLRNKDFVYPFFVVFFITKFLMNDYLHTHKIKKNNCS